MFGLGAAYRADDSPEKVDLGVGAYRGGDGKPFVLPAVGKVCLLLRRITGDHL
jgi:aspartate aminotransferase